MEPVLGRRYRVGDDVDGARHYQGLPRRPVRDPRLISRSAKIQLTAPLSAGLPGAPAPFSYGLGILWTNNGWMIQNPEFNGYIGGPAHLPKRDISIMVENTNGPRTAP